MRRKEERSKQGQTNNKAKQHSAPKAVTFPKENELVCKLAIHVHTCAAMLLSIHVHTKCSSGFDSLSVPRLTDTDRMPDY